MKENAFFLAGTSLSCMIRQASTCLVYNAVERTKVQPRSTPSDIHRRLAHTSMLKLFYLLTYAQRLAPLV